jgi:pimeloyl-ACP methyl ester carboxylesterase
VTVSAGIQTATVPRQPIPPLEPGTVTGGEWTFYHRSSRAGSGSDAAIVHVHGFGISGTYLEPTAALLAAHADTYIPDLPGAGRTKGPAKGLTIERMADALAAYCAAVGVERASFVGNSLGCPIILELALERRDLIDRIVFVGPAGGPNNRPLGRAVGQLLMDAVREPMSLAPIAGRDYLRFGPVRSLSLFRAMTRYPALERLSLLDVPTLVVIGTRDPLIDLDRLGDAFDSVPHVTGVSMPGAHALNHSHPEQLAAIITEYLAGRPVADADVEGLVLIEDRDGAEP